MSLVAEIRPNERRSVYASFVVIFGIVAGHTLLETARDALFLSRLPPARLAWVYLATALVALLLFVAQEHRRTPQNRRSLAAWLVTSALVTMVFWLLAARPDVWILYALYTWSGVFASLVLVRFWTLMGDVFTTGQAKRLFAFIGVGSVLGAIFGAYLARVLAATLEPRHILGASSVVLLFTGLGSVFLLPAPGPKSSPSSETRSEGLELLRPFGAVWSRPYLRRVAGIVLLAAVTLTLVDFLFKNEVAKNVAPDRLASFFAGTYLVLNVLALVAQLFLVSWLVRRLRVNRVLSVLPALVLGGITGIIFGGGLLAALALKGFDGVLRHSLHRTAVEVLYVPLTGGIRSRVKGLIDVLGQRGGQALASLLILGSVALSDNTLVCAVVVALLAAAWIATAATLESHYIDLFRETLSEVSMQTRFNFPEMDLASLETLLRSLNSADDNEVVAALDLFAEQERVHLIPALILFHPSPRVVKRTLELFAAAGRQDCIGILSRLFEHDDAEVRAATLRAHSWLVGPRQDLYERSRDDLSPIVSATALVGLASYAGGESGEQAWRDLLERAESGSVDERLALARAIRYSPGAGYEEILRVLARGGNVEIGQAVGRAMREILSPGFIPVLLEMLPNRALRKEARATLVEIGSEALAQLDAIMADPAADADVRLHVPRTIGFFPPRSAADVLCHHLATVDDAAIRYRILRALGRCRAADPSLALDETFLLSGIDQTLREIFCLIHWRLAMVSGSARAPARSTPVQEVIVDLLSDKEELALECLFRHVGLLYPKEDARSLHRGVRSKNAEVRDSSRELLDHLLAPPLKGPVLALADDIGDAERLQRARPYHEPRELDYETVLGDLLVKGDVGMRCLVMYQAADLGLQGLRSSIQLLSDDPSAVVATAVRRALAALSQREADAHGS